MPLPHTEEKVIKAYIGPEEEGVEVHGPLTNCDPAALPIFSEDCSG